MAVHVPPSVTAKAFSCPHCGAYTSQFWYEVWLRELSDHAPNLLGDEDEHYFRSAYTDLPDDIRRDMIARINVHRTGLIILEERTSKSSELQASNLHLSKCLHCKKVAAWVRDRLVFPDSREGALPNQDLPEDIIRDFEEARSVVNVSPRGAAALLRLCVQKLCIHLLGSESSDINKDIGLLVKRGLNPLVQKALDTVRVVGNESVHPGTMDLKDDRATALLLFNLVNSIAEQLISHPKEVERIYSTLPPGKLQGIENRDKP